jgi:hypothetical protein
MHLALSSGRLRRAADVLAQPLHGAIASLITFRSGLRDGLDVMNRYEALARLSDRDLARRHLNRQEIARAALGDGSR